MQQKKMDKITFFDGPDPPHRGYSLGGSLDEQKAPFSKKKTKMSPKWKPKSIKNQCKIRPKVDTKKNQQQKIQKIHKKTSEHM